MPPILSGRGTGIGRAVRRSGVVVVIAFAQLAPTPLVRAANAGPSETARQLAGLFMQGCRPFAGNPTALRAWAEARKPTPVPEQARVAFLNGAPGVVFDASTEAGKFVLVSSDDGLCSSITDRAMGKDVEDALEATLREAGIAFRMAIDRDDRMVPALHFREYLATMKGRLWRILAATIKDRVEGRAMLTAAPG